MPYTFRAGEPRDGAPAGLGATAFLVGTTAYNAHVQHMVRALDEAGALYQFRTAGADSFSGAWSGAARRLLASWSPRADRQLRRRAVPGLPADRVHSTWTWEVLRLAAARLGALRVEDWCWEHGEWALDRACAAEVRKPVVGAFLGVEHGALLALRAARRHRKPGVIAFLSPHRATRAAWVDSEFERDPSLRTQSGAAVDALSADRDRRRDDEADAADFIVTNSSFTTRSLVDAGFAADRILTVPLGGPDPVAAMSLAPPLAAPRQFVYVGPVSVRKGAHYLLRAWRHVAGPGVELHFYGKILLPTKVIEEAQRARGGAAIHFHGSVPGTELPAVYRRASALVFPTLCDGFGMVVSEALANGLPVITTRNAGAADAIEDGRSGRIVAPADEGALIDVLQWGVDHPDALDAMRPAALAAASRWTWADFREQFRQVLGEALSREAHARG